MRTGHSYKDRMHAMTHVDHELRAMLVYFGRYRELQESESDDWHSRNAFLEGSLLHARSLIEFLAKKRGTDDIGPNDFLQCSWDRTKAKHLETERVPINKLVSHLSWARLDHDAQTPSATVFRDVVEAMSAFCDALEAKGDSGLPILRATLDNAALLCNPHDKRSMSGLSTDHTGTTTSTAIVPLLEI